MSYPALDMHSALDAHQSEKPGYGSTTLIKNIEIEQRTVEVKVLQSLTLLFFPMRECATEVVCTQNGGEGQRVR
jgi:hypothetical protein